MDEKARESNRLRQRKFLATHKEEVNAKRRDKYHERVSRGKCPRCGGRVKKGRTLCIDCCDYMLDLNRKYAKQKKVAGKKAAAPKKVTKVAATKAVTTKSKVSKVTKPATRGKVIKPVVKAPKKKVK